LTVESASLINLKNIMQVVVDEDISDCDVTKLGGEGVHVSTEETDNTDQGSTQHTPSEKPPTFCMPQGGSIESREEEEQW